jgi:hypothetical protein
MPTRRAAAIAELPQRNADGVFFDLAETSPGREHWLPGLLVDLPVDRYDNGPSAIERRCDELDVARRVIAAHVRRRHPGARRQARRPQAQPRVDGRREQRVKAPTLAACAISATTMLSVFAIAPGGPPRS